MRCHVIGSVIIKATVTDDIVYSKEKMEKIKNWFKNYFKKNSKLKIFGDVLFYILIILMIIPSTRRVIFRLF